MDYDESDMTEEEFDERWAAARPAELDRRHARITRPSVHAGEGLELVATHSSSSGSHVTLTGVPVS